MSLSRGAVQSFLNQTPYKTFSQFISQAKKFKVKRKTFDELIEIMVKGKCQNLRHIEEVVSNVFSQFEDIFEELGFDLYYDDVDPNKPMKRFA